MGAGLMQKASATLLLPFCFFCFLTSCAPQVPPTATFCDIARPLRLLSAEIDWLSTESLRQIDRHNSIGEQRCGWRA